MKKRFAKITKEDTAAVAIIVAIMITVFIGLLAFVVDIGYMYEMRRQLQSAADGAALAGMMEKIYESDDAKVLEVIEDYAEKNDLIDNSIDLEVLGSPETEITEEYVLVSVRKVTKRFFAPAAFGSAGSQYIYAQAKAQRVFITGGKGLVPWGVATINPLKAEASVNDTTIPLDKVILAEDLKSGLPTLASADGGTEALKGMMLASAVGDTAWEGLLPISGPADGNGSLVNVTIYNSQGFAEVFTGVGSIVVHGPDDVVTNVWLEDNVRSEGQTTNLWVHSAEKPSARIDNVKYSAFFETVSGSGIWWAEITAPHNTETLETFEVEVSVGNDKFINAARLIVRGQSSPIESIDFGPLHFSAAGGATPISVKMRDLEVGKVYDLKVSGDPESGNFAALDLSNVYRDGVNVGVGGPGDYLDNIILFPGEIMIGDIISTNPGNMAQPTIAHINERLSTDEDGYNSYEAWLGGDPPKPAGCRRLLAVPIIERIERLNGKSEVIVVSIAQFYLEDYEKIDNNQVNITGVFLKHFLKGIYDTEQPASGLFTEKAILVKPSY